MRKRSVSINPDVFACMRLLVFRHSCWLSELRVQIFFASRTLPSAGWVNMINISRAACVA